MRSDLLSRVSEITSPRLRFRLLNEEDTVAWMEFFASPQALKFLPFGLNSVTDCESWIKRQQQRYMETGMGLYALIEKESGMLAGQCGLLVQEIDNQTELEIGYHLIPRFQGAGYATEAAVACKDFAFTNKLAESLISIIHIDNTPSQRVAERNGMKRTAQTIFRNIPVYVYRIQREEWLQAKSEG